MSATRASRVPHRGGAPTGHRQAPRIRRRWAATGIAVLLLPLWLGCSPRAQTNAPSGPAPGPRPRSTASLAILTPAPGSEVTGPTLRVKLRLTGGEIVPQTSTNLTPDKGHVHLSLDGKVISMIYGVEQDVPVAAGPHLLQAEFVAMDHFPFNPRVTTVATFTAK